VIFNQNRRRVVTMKKAIALLSISSMIALAACSSSPTPGKQDNSSSTKTTDTGKSGEKKTLEFWYIDPGDKEKVYLEAVERFKKKHPDVEVKTLQTPNDTYKQKFAVAMSGGTPPDVFHSWGGGWLKEFVNQG